MDPQVTGQAVELVKHVVTREGLMGVVLLILLAFFGYSLIISIRLQQTLHVELIDTLKAIRENCSRNTCALEDLRKAESRRRRHIVKRA